MASDPITFRSPSNPDWSLSYVQLNPGAEHSLVFCYGAAGSSTVLQMFHAFLASHQNVSLLCIDRWTQGKNVSRHGPSLFLELSTITLELLDSLRIERFSLAAHSAGVYQMLHLAKTAAVGRVENLFSIAAHIPAPFTGSRAMEYMCSMPNSLFKTVTTMDSALAGTWVEKVFSRLVKKNDDKEAEDVFLVSKTSRERLFQQIRADNKHSTEQAERLDLDYRLGYERIPGVDRDFLVRLFTECTTDMIWFAADGDVFFGPATVHRIAKDMNEAKVEIVTIPEATHADIFVRTRVWEMIFDKIIGQDMNGQEGRHGETI
ncbi:uncharacterized protein PV06_09614 [Exophiala oligosperma]|uniref:Uncharacterized protein n=2 Tax=Chaetothyriales TaxID=34395 RepID=A0A0D2D647_9EURO|nr:uncharacterized protein PV06_09614 [Exophiala oligosperma]KAJ9638494.1 hypothetical protein H2204_004264 [Knufia peltigerae]KIW38663.1 hypothetical protein PV06_09614 [Exophiala oligosperma]